GDGFAVPGGVEGSTDAQKVDDVVLVDVTLRAAGDRHLLGGDVRLARLDVGVDPGDGVADARGAIPVVRLIWRAQLADVECQRPAKSSTDQRSSRHRNWRP